MHIFQKKKSAYKPQFSSGKQKTIQCSACDYIRQETDTNPKWQCPNCKVAYNKVADGRSPRKAFKRVSRLKNRARKTIKPPRKKMTKKDIKDGVGLFGAWSGLMTWGKGTAKVCAGIAANPLLKGIGIGILVISIGFLIWNGLK